MIAILFLVALPPQTPVAVPSAPPAYALPADPRIQTVEYRIDQVVPLRVASGYAVVVEFATEEQVENVVVGDAAGWQVTLNHGGDRLIVKPLGTMGTTNMVVLTNLRRYVFLLQSADDPSQAAFALRFAYPSSSPSAPTERPNRATYTLKGSRSLFPLAMTDDGARTIVTWAAATPIPAIFAVDKDGRESLVNGRMVDNDYVIEGVVARYVLRRARDKAVATRMTGKHK